MKIKKVFSVFFLLFIVITMIVFIYKNLALVKQNQTLSFLLNQSNTKFNELARQQKILERSIALKDVSPNLIMFSDSGLNLHFSYLESWKPSVTTNILPSTVTDIYSGKIARQAIGYSYFLTRDSAEIKITLDLGYPDQPVLGLTTDILEYKLFEGSNVIRYRLNNSDKWQYSEYIKCSLDASTEITQICIKKHFPSSAIFPLSVELSSTDPKLIEEADRIVLTIF